MGALRKGYAINFPEKVQNPLSPPLTAGIYTIGNGGYFPTIDSAFKKLSVDGIAGEVFLELIDDLYIAPAREYGFLLNGPIPGTGPNSRVTIKPAAHKNVTIEGNCFAVLRFLNTNYVTIDGVGLTGTTSLTIHSLYTAQYPWNDCMEFVNNSDHNVIQNSIFICEDITRQGTGIVIFNSNSNSSSLFTPDSNLIQNNFMKKVGQGIYVGNYFHNNNIRPQGNIIRGNFIGSGTDSMIAWGIHTDYTKNSIVENNIVQNVRYLQINYPNPGISSDWDYNCIIRNNFVHNIYTSGGAWGARGLFIYENGNSNLIYNNMVYDIRSSSNLVAGIHILNQTNPKIYFNSVYLSGSGSGANSNGSAALYMESANSGAEVKNNILVNTRDESPYTASALFSGSNITNSDYNDLYSESNANNCLVNISGVKYKTLAAWQNTGKDLHGISEMPNFIKEDLHINQVIPTYIESGGTPITEINSDFDGDSRNALTTDIGADEFDGIVKPHSALVITPNVIEFGNFKVGEFSDTISIVVKNQSSQTVNINSISNSQPAFHLLNIPVLPLFLVAYDSIMFKVFFNPSTYGVYDDIIVISNSDTINQNASVSLTGNVFLLGPQFQMFYDKVNNASTIPQKNTIVDSFMTANPVLPFNEDTIAHFIYRGSANIITIPSDVNAWHNSAWTMYKLIDTDLWFKAETFEMDARIDYKFLINETNWIFDPKNPRRSPGGFGDNSELAMPDYIDAPEILYYSGILHGSTFDTTFYSPQLANSRMIRVYMPPGYDPASTDSYVVAIFHDGSDFINLAKAKNILDYLIDKKFIQPVIAVFIPPVDRNAEYGGGKKNEYSEFIANNLMNYIDSKYKTKKDPSSRATIGISAGSYISLLIGYNYNNIFGNVGAFSGANGDDNTAYSGDKKNLKLYIDVGTYEKQVSGLNMLLAVREFYDIVQSKGYDITYREWHEYHSWGNWRTHLDIALEYFFPGDSATVGVKEADELPSNYSLSQNFPNPFNNSSTLKYSIPNSSKVIIKVFDILGNEIETLANEEKPAGTYEVTWHATNLPSGVYFYRIQAGNFINTKKMVLLQ